jgi:hypothetical protein
MTGGYRGGAGVVVVVYAGLASAFGVVAVTGLWPRLPSGSPCPRRGRRRLPLRSGPPTFNINDREDVREFFNQVVQASHGVPEAGRRPFRGPTGPVRRSDTCWRSFVLTGLPDIN